MSSGLGKLLRGTDEGALRSRDQLLRNGHVLTFNSVLTAALGAAYWAFAAHNYDADTVGRNYSAVSAMMLLAGVGQLNLTNVLLRFVPTAAQRTRRLVTRAYLAACASTVFLAGAFLLLQPVLSPGLGFLHDPLLGPCFVLASAAYAVFVIQDGVLTGLRRTDWVVLENAVFAVAKIVLVGVLAVTLPASGILLSWTLAIAVAVTVTNGFLYARAFPGTPRPRWTSAPTPAGPRPATSWRTTSPRCSGSAQPPCSRSSSSTASDPTRQDSSHWPGSPGSRCTN